jgi:integrase
LEAEEAEGIFGEFLREYAMRGRTATYLTYRRLLSPFERWLRERGVSDPDRQHVLEYLASRPGWCNTTRNTFLSALRSWARWARGYAEDGPTQARLSRIETIRDFPHGREERPALSLEQIGLLLGKAEPDDYALLWILLWFGLRVGELGRIRSVDYEKGELVVETEKAGGARTLYFDAYTGSILGYAQDRGLLGLPPKEVWRRLRRYSYYAPVLTPHVCRHTFATHMAKAVSREALRRMLGHSPPTVTEMYIHPWEEEVREAMLRRHYLLPFEPAAEEGAAGSEPAGGGDFDEGVRG